MDRLGYKQTSLVRAVEPPGTNSRAYVGPLNAVLRPPGLIGLQAVDLFSGAGGLSLGFRARGFAVSGLDSNPAAVDTYTRNVGPATVVRLDANSSVPSADILLAGPPCQPWSRAGARLGESDGREGLLVAASIAERVRPKGLVVENVPELARGRGRTYLDGFVKRIKGIQGAGYHVFEKEMNAADFGVPQNRRRIFLIAISAGTFTFPEGLP